MNRWLEIVEGQIEGQMVVVVPRDCFLNQIVRRIIDEMMIDAIAQRAEVFQDAKLNAANVTVFEELGDKVRLFDIRLQVPLIDLHALSVWFSSTCVWAEHICFSN